MLNGDQQQGMYTPIPQNMTDSDSEEEFHLQTSVRSLRSSQHSTTPSTVTMASNRFTEPRDSLSDVRFTSGKNDSHMDDEERGAQHFHEADNVAILNTNLRKGQPMSAVRKFCFIVSIFVCLLTIVLFVWVLPCSDELTCPAASERIRTQNWLRTYERLELKGAINVVRGVRGRSMNLVLMYRGNKMFGDTDKTIPSIRKRNGIISLMGSSGQVGWFDEMVNEPRAIDCSLIDADLSGENDCLIVDELGEIGCINPVSGQWIWHTNERTSNSLDKLSFPLVVPDLNNDSINELLVVTSNNGIQFNALKLISGRTGKSFGGNFTLENCSYIHKLQIDADQRINFNCIKNDTESRLSKTLTEIYLLLTNKSFDISIKTNASQIPQHKFYGQRKDTIRQSNIYSVNGKQLIVENYGICPEYCNVSVTLVEQRNGKQHVIRYINGSHMYGMVPAKLSFNKSNDPRTAPVHGFVIKFWEFGRNKTGTKTNQTETSLDTTIANNSMEINSSSTQFNKFASILRKKRAWNLPNTKVSQPDISESASTSAAILPKHMRFIKETVILIVFNSSDVRIENTSQSNIVQLCRLDDKKNEICQPDLNYQENSVLIADLDKDGSQELVSYYSTFVEDENDHTKWKLMTYVQLLRLEAELPKLYAIDNKH